MDFLPGCRFYLDQALLGVLGCRERQPSTPNPAFPAGMGLSPLPFVFQSQNSRSRGKSQPRCVFIHQDCSRWLRLGGMNIFFLFILGLFVNLSSAVPVLLAQAPPAPAAEQVSPPEAPAPPKMGKKKLKSPFPAQLWGVAAFLNPLCFVCHGDGSAAHMLKYQGNADICSPRRNHSA